MQQIRIIAGAVALLIFLMWQWLLPVPIMHASPIFLAIGSGALFGACLYVAFAGIGDDDYNVDTYEAKSKYKSRIIILAVASFFIGGGYFFYCSIVREEAFIRNNPMIVVGKITDGTATTTQRRMQKSTTYQLIVEYKDKNDVAYNTPLEVTQEKWDKVGKGSEVKVVYEKEHPGICKLLMNEKDYKTYINAEANFYPSIQNITNILSCNSDSCILKELGDGWEFGTKQPQDTFHYLYTNYYTHDILINSTQGFIYANEEGNIGGFNTILKEAKAGMQSESNASKSKDKAKVYLFSNDKIRIRFMEKETLKRLSIGMSISKNYIIGFNFKDKFNTDESED